MAQVWRLNYPCTTPKILSNCTGKNTCHVCLSSNLLKSKIPMSGGGVGGGGGWGWLVGRTNFQLLMLSSNLLKSKIPMYGGGLVEPTSNF